MSLRFAIAVAIVTGASAMAQESRPADQAAGRWACCSDASQLPAGDPATGEIPMPGAAPGWSAFHLYTSDTWRLHCIGAGRFTGYHGSPQVIVLDEKGRCVILQSDSGKWIPQVAVDDGRACSAWASGELDPAVAGEEIYVGSTGGNLYQVVHSGKKGWQSTLVATAEGASLSKLVIADLDPGRPGNEMLAFTNAGAVFDVVLPAAPGARFRFQPIGDLGSRVRDAVLLPGSSSRPPRVAAILQDGEVALVTRTTTGIDRQALCREPMSLARIARRSSRVVAGSAGAPKDPEVLYVARVDGLILRFTEGDGGAWVREIIYAGPQGPRGLAAGRFDADPSTETVAVFGYSKKVQILSRRPGEPWRADTVYTDPGGGHWLAAAELDGRNSTDELVGGGFSHHVFMVGREPGYGLVDVPIEPRSEDGREFH
jgi:hypothetical protein